MTNATPFRAGFVAIIGRANVGKSTLLNAMLGQKLAIVSPKPHTTRHKVLGVLNGEGFQAALLDTPGFLRRGRDQLDAAMSRQLASALAEADLALLVVEPRRSGDVERDFMRQLALTRTPTVLVINKVDTVSKKRLLPIIQGYAEAHKFQEVVPVSAVERDGVELLLEQIAAHLPEGEAEDGDLASRVGSLTPSQLRILEGLKAGRLNKQIAFDLGVSEATIKAHLTSVFRKLGVQNRTQAVILAKQLDAV